MNTPLFLGALTMTLAVEIPIFVGLLHRLADVPVRQAVVVAAVVNLVSYPLFVFLIVPIASRYVQPAGAVIVGEVAVCLLEAGMVRAWLRRDLPIAIGVALVANGCSIAAGLIVFALFRVV